ncbi:MAG: MBL fold metallo-hydrolase [Candidatus Heimdallarchaeota archaeon]
MSLSYNGLKRVTSWILIVISISFIGILQITTNTNWQVCSLESNIGHVDSVEITVLVDNYANGTLQAPWGVSMLVETNNQTILVDTGPDPDALRNNANVLGKDLSLVDYIVISHEHRDHVGGLSYMAETHPNITVYVPHFMDSFVKTGIEDLGFDVVDNHLTTILSPGIALVGELRGPPYEHALTVNVANVDLVVVVGCSHLGVENIVAKAIEDLEVDPYLVIGGFHLDYASTDVISNTATKLIDLGVDKIYPIHCIGNLIRNYIEENYPDNYGEGCVGTHLIIDQEIELTSNTNIVYSIVIISSLFTPIVYRIVSRISKKKQ